MEVKPVAPDTARALLEECDLPTDDLADPTISLLGAFEGSALIGVAGLQRCGDVGLLRSLAVATAARDRGVARVLCERVFQLAATQQLGALWLLTTSARDYFTRHGFVAVARDSAPAAIQETAQFASLCPASAVVMRRDR
jgi:amino-acid N-acetyltransferase